MVSTLTMCHHLQLIMLLLTFGDISQCTQWKMRINIYLTFIYYINNSKVHSRQVMIPFWGLCNKSFRITGVFILQHSNMWKHSGSSQQNGQQCLANETITKLFMNYLWMSGEDWPHLIFKFFIGVRGIEDGGNAWCLNVSFIKHYIFLSSSQNYHPVWQLNLAQKLKPQWRIQLSLAQRHSTARQESAGRCPLVGCRDSQISVFTCLY